MSASLKIDTAPFMQAVREYVLQSNKELAAELNRRMFYVILRAFVLLEPHSISAARSKARAYLEEVKQVATRIGARVRSAKNPLKRIDLIAQARRIANNKKALTQSEIGAGKGKKGVSTIRRRGIQGQGYIKSSLARALQSLSKLNLNRSFSQFGRAAKVSKRTGQVTKPEQAPNSALVGIAAEYGLTIPAGTQSNVGVFRGTKARVTGAKPGLNPTVTAEMEGFVNSDRKSVV